MTAGWAYRRYGQQGLTAGRIDSRAGISTTGNQDRQQGRHIDRRQVYQQEAGVSTAGIDSRAGISTAGNRD